MARSEDDLQVRLQQAALDLFRERGFDRTTAAEIAAQAGVTERTFFRHFPDKREVLFDGEAVLRNALTAAIAEVPEGLGPLDTLFHAFRSVVPLLEANRPFAKPRQEVIAATPALAERELAKYAALAGALAAALRARGTDDLRAVLAAQTGMTAFTQATLSWLDAPSPSLGDRLDVVRRALTNLLSGGPD
ncbi:MAG TPA: TetR family transcriptional regulator [Rubellimicrobium sp.]|jgi:AcrR family transcriptional regulator|nr:TetR family transcriptional regulator [Rubellimicrobium sp.]